MKYKSIIPTPQFPFSHKDISPANPTPFSFLSSLSPPLVLLFASPNQLILSQFPPSLTTPSSSSSIFSKSVHITSPWSIPQSGSLLLRT
ncbi:hypothetical protein AKJ16_DCAP14816 [Drosera capensis]